MFLAGVFFPEPGRTIDLTLPVAFAGYGITAPELGYDDYAGLDVKGKAVLVDTGWSEHWSTPAYFEQHSFLNAGAALFLRDTGAVLVGIDSHNIDDTRGRARPVHSTLLGRGVLIVEHLTNLAALPAHGFRFSAVPVKVSGMGTFPVRAFAVVG